MNDEVGVLLDGERVGGGRGGVRNVANIWGERYSHTCAHQVCSMASNTVASLTILV